jgi:phage terminase large subunit-like protein
VAEPAGSIQSAVARADLEGFAEFCLGLRLERGEPLKLFPEQRMMLDDFFAGARETLILIPKKNGKTTLLAALSLYHLLTCRDASCVVGASSRDQATILYDQATGLIERSGLQPLFNSQKGYRRIDAKWDRGRIRVLAADENTADGVIPTLALVDELHRHKTDGLYGVFRDGLGPRNGQMITISTAGDDERSPLGQLRTKAYSLPGLKHDRFYHHVHTDEFAMHEWALTLDDDRDDLELVVQANPAPWQTIEALSVRQLSPSMTPWQWARFACGVWVFGEQGAISEKEWRACEDPAAAIPDGAGEVVIGVDLGWRWDTTAIVPVWADGERLVVGEAAIIVPPRDGSMTDYRLIWAVVEKLSERYSQPRFVVDPEAGGEQLAQQIEAELDALVTEHSQKPGPMALAAQRLSEAVGAHRLVHAGDPELTRHVLAAAAKPVGEGWRLVKPQRGQVIDGAIALAMAISVASAPAPVFEPMFAFV